MESEDSLAKEPSGEYHYGSTAQKESGRLQEADSLNKSFHTVEEYLALPDEHRVELIDGRFYEMASPNGIHQQITFMLWRAFFECIEAHGMPCKVQGAPFDVRLDAYTVVQPDVMVFCEDPSQAFAARATIPPELIIEVLSKSTAFKDRHLKLFKYRNAGVREVWLVSPDDRTVEIYLFTESEKEPITYSFDDKIPVHISEDKCVIDFAEINKRLPPL
jgi:Uma2 family endonuclease